MLPTCVLSLSLNSGSVISIVEGRVDVFVSPYLTSTAISVLPTATFPCFILVLVVCLCLVSHSPQLTGPFLPPSSLIHLPPPPPPSSLVPRSTTSSDAASLHEALSAPSSSLSNSTPSLASPAPSPSPSPAFLRPRPAGPQSRAKRLSHLFLRGRSNSDRDRAVGEREREVWAHSAAASSHHYLPPASSSAPGLIKIYGDALSSGANYRSLLASVHSTARQLIAQVITRYIERERDEADDAGIKGGRRSLVLKSAVAHYRELFSQFSFQT